MLFFPQSSVRVENFVVDLIFLFSFVMNLHERWASVACVVAMSLCSK